MFLIMSSYVVHLGMGHTLQCKTIKSATIQKYLAQAGKRIHDERKRFVLNNPDQVLHWINPLTDPATGKYAADIINGITEIKRWEACPNRREPLTTDMILWQKLQGSSSTPHSIENAMYDWQVVGIHCGPRLSEWAQEDHVKRLDQVRRAIDNEPLAFLITDLLRQNPPRNVLRPRPRPSALGRLHRLVLALPKERREK